MIEHFGMSEGFATLGVVLGSITFAIAVHRHQRLQLKARDEAYARRITPTFEEGDMRSNVKQAKTSDQRFADAREERMAREAIQRQQKFGVEDDVRRARKNATAGTTQDRRHTDDSSMSLANPGNPISPLNPLNNPVYDSTPVRSSDSNNGACGNGWGGVETGSNSPVSDSSCSTTTSSD